MDAKTFLAKLMENSRDIRQFMAHTVTEEQRDIGTESQSHHFHFLCKWSKILSTFSINSLTHFALRGKSVKLLSNSNSP